MGPEHGLGPSPRYWRVGDTGGWSLPEGPTTWEVWGAQNKNHQLKNDSSPSKSVLEKVGGGADSLGPGPSERS